MTDRYLSFKEKKNYSKGKPCISEKEGKNYGKYYIKPSIYLVKYLNLLMKFIKCIIK